MPRPNPKSELIPLPRHAAALSAVLEDVRGAIDSLIAAHREMCRLLDAAKKLSLLQGILPILESGLPTEKWQSVQSRAIRLSKDVCDKQKSISVANRKLFAEGIRPLELFARYLGQEDFKQDLAILLKANLGLKQSVRAQPIEVNLAVQYLALFTKTLERVVAHLISFQHAIYDELAKLADSSTDKKKKTDVRLPRNLKVLRLIELIDRRDPSQTQKDVALEFTKGDTKKAEAILKAMRRYLKRVEEAET